MVKSNEMLVLARNLKTFREQAGLTQVDLAILAGINPYSIPRWEKGEHAPQTESLSKLAKALGRPMEHFFATDPPQGAPPPAVFFRVRDPEAVTDDDMQKLRALTEAINERAALAELRKRKKKP